MKTIIKTSLLTIIAMLLISTDALATNGMRLIGLGPVQDSMGGVGVGLALDGASILTNPAGMGFLPGRIDFGASFFKPTVDYTATGAASGARFESDRGPSPIPAFGLIIPINDSFRFGIGAYGTSGMGVDYKADLYGSTTYTSYSQMRFAPGLAFKINDMISVGAVVNVMYATMEFNAASATGQQPHMGASSLGIGGTLGVLVKPVKFLQIGLAYESKSFFQDFQFNTNLGRDKIEFNQPQVATIGLGVEPIKNLLIGFDVQWINWSDVMGKDQPKFTQNSSGANPFNMDWSDQFVYKVGIQYTVIPMLVLRAGYNYGKMPLNGDRAFENIAFPAVSEHHITAGIGLNLGQHFALNLGGMISPSAKITGSNPAQGIASYETKMWQYQLDAGIAYTF